MLPTTITTASSMARMRVLLVLLSLFTARAVCGGIDQIRILGPQGVNLWQLKAARNNAARASTHPPLLVQQADSAPPSPSSEGDDEEGLSALERKFPAHWFTQTLDHFANASGHTFEQRYWISTRHYRPREGAPVIVLDGGETSGVGRLPFLDTGIVEILTKATGGVGVILEHRYYGASRSSLVDECEGVKEAVSGSGM